MRLFLSTIVFVVAGCVGSGSAPTPLLDPAFQNDPYSIEYIRPSGNTQIRFAAGTMYIAPTQARARAGAGDQELLIDEYQLMDCSSEALRCLRAGPYVFAVPRSPADRDEAYIAAGLRFVVQPCEVDCSRIEIQVGCDRWERGTCVLDPAANIQSNEFVYMSFVYEGQVGVRAIRLFPTTSEPFRLMGARGILSGME